MLKKKMRQENFTASVAVRDLNNNYVELTVEVLSITTGHGLYLVAYNAEGLEGAFVVRSFLWSNRGFKMLQRIIQKAYTRECEDWREKYGDAD